MDTNPSNARELVALRVTLTQALTLDEIRAVNWATVTTAARPALARGWTGDELARLAIGDISTTTTSPGAVIVTALRDLGTIDPPRETTPQPPPIRDVLAGMHTRNQPTPTPHAWATKVRAAADRRRTYRAIPLGPGDNT